MPSKYQPDPVKKSRNAMRRTPHSAPSKSPSRKRKRTGDQRPPVSISPDWDIFDHLRLFNALRLI